MFERNFFLYNCKWPWFVDSTIIELEIESVLQLYQTPRSRNCRISQISQQLATPASRSECHVVLAGGMSHRARGRSSSAGGCSARGGIAVASRLRSAALQSAATTRHWNYADYCNCPNRHRYRRSIKGKRLNVLSTWNYANVTKTWDVISHDLPFYCITNNNIITCVLWMFNHITVL